MKSRVFYISFLATLALLAVPRTVGPAKLSSGRLATQKGVEILQSAAEAFIRDPSSEQLEEAKEVLRPPQGDSLIRESYFSLLNAAYHSNQGEVHRRNLMPPVTAINVIAEKSLTGSSIHRSWILQIWISTTQRSVAWLESLRDKSVVLSPKECQTRIIEPEPTGRQMIECSIAANEFVAGLYRVNLQIGSRMHSSEELVISDEDLRFETMEVVVPKAESLETILSGLKFKAPRDLKDASIVSIALLREAGARPLWSSISRTEGSIHLLSALSKSRRPASESSVPVVAPGTYLLDLSLMKERHFGAVQLMRSTRIATPIRILDAR